MKKEMEDLVKEVKERLDNIEFDEDELEQFVRDISTLTPEQANKRFTI